MLDVLVAQGAGVEQQAPLDEATDEEAELAAAAVRAAREA